MSLTRTQKLEKIVQLNTLMNQANDLHELLEVILIETEKMFNVEGTSILLEDKITKMLYFYIATGKQQQFLKTIQMKRGEGICGHVFQTGKVLMENHPEKSKLFSNKVDKKSKFVTRNLLGVPLKIKKKSIGVIELVNKIDCNFTKGDVEFLEAIASQVSMTLEKARLMEEKLQAQRLATVGETIAGLSHCIKNILNGLKGGAYIINKNLDSGNLPKISIGWNIVQKNINKISSLTLDMLHYSKHRDPEYKIANLNSVLQDVIDLLEEKAAQRNISFILNFDEDLNKMEFDPQGIYRCVLNLVSNSIDALENIPNGKIEIVSQKSKNQAVIKVKDNGCGMDRITQEQLFSKFFSTKGSKGTGLGLPVTKKIIEEHGGSLILESQKNAGTTFSIKIPLQKNK